MNNQEELIQIQEEFLQVPPIPLTQYLSDGIDLVNGQSLDKMFGYPVSCRFKFCKAILNDDDELRAH